MLFAQVYSTPEGGLWVDPLTWIGGTIPNENDDVVIQGSVYVSNNECHDLTLSNSISALRNVNNASGSITIHGNLYNYGIIGNHPSGNELTVNLFGNLHAGSNVYPQSLNFLGTGNRYLSSDATNIISAVSTISVASSIDTLYAASDISLGLTSAVPPPLFTGTSEQCTFSLVNPYLGMAFDLSLNNCKLNLVKIIGNAADTLHFNNSNTSVYIQNSYLDNLTLTGTVRVHSGNTINNIVNNGNIYNYQSYHYSLDAYGSLVNNGQISSNPSGYNLYLVTYGDITNYGVMRPYHLYLAGAGDRNLKCRPENPFSPTGNIYVSAEVGSVFAGSDLYFTDFDGIRGPISLFAYDSTRTARNLYFTDVDLEDADITAGTNSILSGTGLRLIDSNLTGFRLEGDISFHGTCSINDVLNYAILQNSNSMHYTLTVHGNFTNYGIVRNHPSGYNLTVNAYDDVLNYGSWTCYMLNLYGDDNQNISFGAGHSFAGTYLNDMNSMAGISVVGDDLYLENSTWDLNSVALYLNPGDFDLILNNSVLSECSVISSVNSNLNMTGNSRIGNVSFQAITNIGTLMFYTDTIISRDFVNYGTVQNYNNFHRTLTVQGNIINSGIIRNHPSGYDLYINALGNVINTGTWSSNTLSLTGSSAQLISFPSEHGFLGSYCIDVNSVSPILTNADLNFANTSIDFNGATLVLHPGGYNMNIDNCTLTDAVIHSTEESILNLVNNSRIYNTSFESITTTGTVNLGSNTTFSGNLINLGIIQNYNSFFYTLFVQGNLDNQGTIRNHPSGYYLILYCSQHFVNSGSININSIYYDGAADQNLTDTGTIMIQNLLDTTPTTSLTLLTDLTLTNTMVDLNGSVLVLNSGTRYGKTLSLHGGNIREVVIIGGNNSRLICDSNAFITEFAADELIMEGTILIYGSATIGHLINHGTIKNHLNFSYTLNVTQQLDNYATISNNTSYNLYLNVSGDVYDYGFLSNNYIDFIANTDQHLYQDATADTIRCASIRKSSASGNLILLSDLNVKGCYIDLYSKRLEMNSTRTSYALQLNGAYITRTYLATSGYSTLSMSGNAYLNSIDGDNLILQGTVIIVNSSHFTNVINYANLRNSPSSSSYLYINEGLTNYGTITDFTYDLYLFISGNFTNHGTISNQQVTLNGNTNQEVILDGTQASALFTITSNIGSSVWYRNSVNTGMVGTYINLTPSDPWLLGVWQPYNVSSDIWGRHITVSAGSVVAAPDNVQILQSGTTIILQWNEVTNATAYNLYSSDSPETGFVVQQIGIIDSNPGDGIVQLSIAATATRKFYRITALP
jgi:hypothetical protein